MRKKPHPNQGEIAWARHGDPLTSYQAAAKVTRTLTDREQAVVYALQGGPATSRELAERLRVGRDSISPRMKPLREQGRVEATGERRDGQTVWRLRHSYTGASDGVSD